VIVEKARRLFIYRGARIHLDRVERLGSFVEIEAPVASDAAGAAETARSIMDDLMEAFGLRDGDAVRASYSDLLEGAA
jgi:adenylate cyclase class 2